MNPAFRTSSPQPSTYSSHHDPASAAALQMGLDGRSSLGSSHRQPSGSPAPMPAQLRQSSQSQYQPNEPRRPSQPQYLPNEPRRPSQPQPQQAANPYGDIPKVPHNESPYEGMTQFCRLGAPSERSSNPSPTRPDSRDDSHSELSIATSLSSFDPASGQPSPTKQFNGSNISSSSDIPVLKEKKSGFFQNRSPFRRKSKHEKDAPQLASANITPTQRNTWVAPAPRPATSASPTRPFNRESRNMAFNTRPSPSPDPDSADPRANFQLNIGNNVFDVASPDARKHAKQPQKESLEDLDPIAQALAELKGVTKQASTRVSADRYHGLSTTPAPPASPRPGTAGASPRPMMNSDLRSAQRGTPPPSYDQPVSRLGAPKPAFTSKQMQQTTASYVAQKRDMFAPGSRGSQQQPSPARPASRGAPPPRATSPAPPRSTSPRPYMGSSGGHQQQAYRAPSPNPYRAASPNPYQAPAASGRPRAQSTSPLKQQPNYGGYNSHANSPSQQQMPRSASPNPQSHARGQSMSAVSGRPQSSRGSESGGNAMVLSPVGDSQRRSMRPTSQYYGNDGGGWAAAAAAGGAPSSGGAVSTRVRSQSSAGNRPVAKDGRPILQYGKLSNSILPLLVFLLISLSSSRCIRVQRRHPRRTILWKG